MKNTAGRNKGPFNFLLERNNKKTAIDIKREIKTNHCRKSGIQPIATLRLI
jgi:hypothetical protein